MSTDDLLSRLEAQQRALHDTWDDTIRRAIAIADAGRTVPAQALDAIAAIDARPHGIFCVDMTYDRAGVPNPTEINIGRFFTTCYFFTKAGVNFPEIYCDLALDGRFPTLARTINPLPDGLMWIRGIDSAPVLTTREELAKLTASRPHGD